MLFKFKAFKGPKNYVFKDPDTGFKYSAHTMKQLLQSIINYRSQNQLSALEELEMVVENYLCLLPQHVGSCERVRQLKRGLFPTLEGGIAVLKNLFFGEENMVDQDTADKRSAICKRCPQNQFPDKGNFLVWADDIAVASTGGKKSAHHKELGNCMACSCPMRAKVWAKGPFPITEEQKINMPPYCWQLSKQQVSPVEGATRQQSKGNN